eukprot:gene10598-12332_t
MFSSNESINMQVAVEILTGAYLHHWARANGAVASTGHVPTPLSIHISVPDNGRADTTRFLESFYQKVFVKQDTPQQCYETIKLGSDEKYLGTLILAAKRCASALFVMEYTGSTEPLGMLESVFDGSLLIDKRPIMLNHTFVLLSNVGQPAITQVANTLPAAATPEAKQEALVETLIYESKQVWSHRFCTRVIAMIPLVG